MGPSAVRSINRFDHVVTEPVTEILAFGGFWPQSVIVAVILGSVLSGSDRSLLGGVVFEQHYTFFHTVTGCVVDLGHRAGVRRLDLVLHLHRLNDEDSLAFFDLIADGDANLDEDTSEGSGDGAEGVCGSTERAAASLASARGCDVEGAIADGDSEVTPVSSDVGACGAAIDHHGDEAGDAGERGVRDDGIVVVDGDAGLAVLFVDDEGAGFAV